MYVVILAGGTGTRLWPRSRRATPKQLLDLVDHQSMLQRTIARVRPLLPVERILVSTGAEYAAPIQAQVPDLPPGNIIVERAGRNTAPCIGLAAIHLQRRAGADDVMISLHADAYIKDEERFRQVLLAAVEAAERDHLVTIGITPPHAETGFGYIQRGERLARLNGQDVYRVVRFTEKPDAATAQRFVETGEYYWNSGMFIWKLSRIMAEMELHQPQLAAQLREIQGALGTPEEEAVTERVWGEVRSQSIDVAIMERAQDVAVVPADIGWSDVGSWDALADILDPDEQGNVVRGAGRYLGVDTKDTFIYSEGRLVATLGLEGMVVVDTGDAILVCPKERAQDVKLLVNRLKAEGHGDLC